MITSLLFGSLLISLACVVPTAQAQDVLFDQVNLPVRDGEAVAGIKLGKAAGSRQIVEVTYKGSAGDVRRALVGVEEKEAQELFDPYHGIPGAWQPELTQLQYKDKVIILLFTFEPDALRGSRAATAGAWVTDGTLAGTRLLFRGGSSSHRPFIVRDSLAVFRDGCELTFFNLNTPGSSSVSRICGTFAEPQGYGNLATTLADGRVVFSARPQDYFFGLGAIYVTDGTSAGTRVLFSSYILESEIPLKSADVNEPSPFRVFQTGHLFVTDGTDVGTHKIEGRIDAGVQLGSTLIYTKSTPEYGLELWSMNLATLESTLVKDILPGPQSSIRWSGFATFNRCNDKVFFIANDGQTGEELWVSDGTPAGTRLTRELIPGPADGIGESPFFDDNNILNKSRWGERDTSCGTNLLFCSQPRADEWSQLNDGAWLSDGTSDGTFRLSPILYYSDELVNEAGVLTFLSPAVFSTGSQSFYQTYLNLFDPSLGPTSSAFLAVKASNQEPVPGGVRLAKSGDSYYMTAYPSGPARHPSLPDNATQLLVASRPLCSNEDFKPVPGQCGCGVEELPTDSNGTIAGSNLETDGSAVCLTSLGPIFVPSAFQGDLTARLQQGGGRPDSLQLTIPPSILNALQVVVTAPSVDGAVSAQGEKEVYAKNKRPFKPQNVVSLVVIDENGQVLRRLAVRRTTNSRFTVRLGRRLRSTQKLGFYYAVAVKDDARYALQTPYKRTGVVKLTRAGSRLSRGSPGAGGSLTPRSLG